MRKILFLSILVSLNINLLQAQNNIFVQEPLAYTNNALEPYISSETIDYHYGKHLQGYINNLNKLLDGSDLQDKNLEYIILNSDGAIFNNAAQVYNHRFYFNTLSPNAKLKPDGVLLEAINKKWGSYDNFKNESTANATKLFGSGWVWLAEDTDGNLNIINTPNAETPLEQNLTPLMVMDVWEHAYYIDYRNKRADHIANIWNVIDWKVIEDRYNK